MTPGKPAIILIPGGWHTPPTYTKLTLALRAAGYEVHVPRLPSTNGTQPPNADLITDTALLRSYVESLVEAGRNVIAIMHSYGGQVGTNALYGLGLETRNKTGIGGGVSHLIYMCAFALPEGGSMVGKVKEFGHEHLLPLAFDFADDNTVLCRDPKIMLIGEAPGIDETEIEKYLSSLVRWNGTCMYQEVSQSAWREIPVTYIYTTQDMTTPLDYQKSMVEEMERQGTKVSIVELETGHCPNLTATAEVVDVVNQVVSEAK